jgi:hypothetical protein
VSERTLSLKVRSLTLAVRMRTLACRFNPENLGWWCIK